MQETSNSNHLRPKAVIFDVDGTLYHQPSLRAHMLRILLGYYLFRPLKWYDLEILRQFRKEREKMAFDTFSGIENEQYKRCRDKTRASEGRIRGVVAMWLLEKPLPYLAKYVFPGVHAFFKQMQQDGIPIGIYSDYRAVRKLNAMGLNADRIIASTDETIDRLKPDPKGLLHLADHFGSAPSECLFIGDRMELDGEAARRAGMPCLIIHPEGKEDPFYENLLTEWTETGKISVNPAKSET